MFILKAQRKEDVDEAFLRYRRYLRDQENSFPKRAYELATSGWYFDPSTNGCPHDAWLDRLLITSTAAADASQKLETTVTIGLLGAYHNGNIVLTYRNVENYALNNTVVSSVRADWLFDEFRSDKERSVTHEIEWSTGTWQITAEDIEYSWQPFVPGVSHTATHDA